MEPRKKLELTPEEQEAEAVSNGHLEVVRLLVEQGADVGLRSQSGRTALELARAAAEFGRSAR